MERVAYSLSALVFVCDAELSVAEGAILLFL